MSPPQHGHSARGLRASNGGDFVPAGPTGSAGAQDREGVGGSWRKAANNSARVVVAFAGASLLAVSAAQHDHSSGGRGTTATWKYRCELRQAYGYMPAAVRRGGRLTRLAWRHGLPYAVCARLAGWSL